MASTTKMSPARSLVRRDSEPIGRAKGGEFKLEGFGEVSFC